MTEKERLEVQKRHQVRPEETMQSSEAVTGTHTQDSEATVLLFCPT